LDALFYIKYFVICSTWWATIPRGWFVWFLCGVFIR